MSGRAGRRPGDKRPAVTMGQLAAAYSPKRIRDLLFLHGLAVLAARRALREGDPLYVPSEWERADPDFD